jgi:hypothetical protein
MGVALADVDGRDSRFRIDMALESNVSEEMKEEPCLRAMLLSVSKGKVLEG